MVTLHFSGQAITLHAERCLNARYRAVGCTLCADTCPATGAITVTEGEPVLDNEACLHCGLCLHHCPTGAFTRSDPIINRLLKTVAALPPGPVDLLCPQQPVPERGFAPLAVQTRRCLVALSPATLLELVAEGREIWLDDTLCAACPLGKIHATLGQIVAEANSWARLLENDNPISLRAECDESPPVINRPVYEADCPPISRRGFFSSLKQLGQDGVTFEETEESAKVGKPVPVSQRLPHFVPPQRAKLLSVIDKIQSSEPKVQKQKSGQRQASQIKNQKSNVKLPVADITINTSQCSACGLCARFCPTAALTFLSDGEQFALDFQATLCLGERCNICVLACPEKAVSIKSTTISPDLLVKKSRYLVAGELMSCQKCGEPIAKGPEHPAACFVCRSSSGKMDLLQSMFGD